MEVGAGSVVGGNSSPVGAGIFLSGDLTIRDSRISFNHASRDGGGLFQEVGSMTLANASILDNVARGAGGGLYGAGAVTLGAGSVVQGNQATEGSGGGIYLSSGTLEVQGASVANNTAGLEGGGMYSNGTLVVRDGDPLGQPLLLTRRRHLQHRPAHRLRDHLCGQPDPLRRWRARQLWSRYDRRMYVPR